MLDPFVKLIFDVISNSELDCSSWDDAVKMKLAEEIKIAIISEYKMEFIDG